MGGERVITVERRLKLTARTCAICGRPFEGWGQQRYCDTPCRRRADYERHGDKRRATRRERYRRQQQQRGEEHASGSE